MPARRLALILPFFLALVLAGACERRAQTEASANLSPHLPRVCAVSPALAQMLVDLKLGDTIVGRHRYDNVVAADVPVVGDQTELDYEMLLSLNPTDVLLQFGERAVPPRLEKLAAAHDWNVRSFDIDSTDDVQRVLLELPRTLGFAEGEAGRAAQVEAKRQAMRLAQQIDAALTPSEAAVQAGPVLLLWSVDPPAAFGPESFLGELLERLGGRNVIEVGGYPELTLEDVLHLDPSTIVLFADDEADVDAAARLGRLATLDIKAARLERLVLVQDPQVLLPATTLPRIAAKFERALATLPPLPQESRGTQAPTAGEGEQP